MIGYFFLKYFIGTKVINSIIIPNIQYGIMEMSYPIILSILDIMDIIVE